MTADFAPARSDHRAVVAVARILKAVDVALTNGDLEALVGWGATSRTYLQRQIRMVEFQGSRLVHKGLDIVREERAPQCDSLLRMFFDEQPTRKTGWIATDSTPAEMAISFVRHVMIWGTALQYELGAIGVRPNADAVSGVAAVFSKEVKTATGSGKFPLSRLKPGEAHNLAERLLVSGLKALGYRRTRNLFDYKAKRTKRSAEKAGDAMTRKDPID